MKRFFVVLLRMVLLSGMVYARTNFDIVFVNNSCYSKVMNTSDFWDKYIEYSPDNKLTLWNEVYFIKDKLSADINYKVDLNNGFYRGTLTGNYTRGINKFWTVEGGLGAYWKNDKIYGAGMASNRVRFNLLFLDFSDFTYLYIPIGERIEMQNILKIRLNAFILAYFNFNFRQEFIDNQFSNMNYGSVEINF